MAAVNVLAETLVCERDKIDNGGFGDGAGFYLSFYEKFRNDLLFAETRPLSPEELACLVKGSALEKNIMQSPLFVDIRDQRQFEKYRIKNSANIPWHELKRKSFLKKRHIVLVDEGYRYVELLEGCVELRKMGFEHVSVLEQGLSPQWAVQGFYGGNSHEGSRVSPRDFYILKFKAPWIVIDVSGNKNSESVFGNLYSIDLNDEAQTIRFKLKEIFDISFKKQELLPSFLVVGKTGEEYSKIEDIVSEDYRPHVYYLEGGLDAYNGFIIRQQRIIEQKKHMKDKSLAKCGS